MSTSEILGAPASSAGDEFHELWALKKVLGLLNPESNLFSVVIEGVPTDLSNSELGSKALAVDVTEVRRTATSHEFIFEQLKYSTAHPTAAWTWHRLTAERTKGRSDTSVIGKLAKAFDAATGKTRIRLVTNQPLANEVRTELPICIEALQGNSVVAPTALSSLRSSTGLPDSRLADFLAAFDISGFGSATRLHLETDILQTISRTTDADARDDLTRLQERISALILPENRAHAEVDRETLLTWLGAGASEVMFPAPNEIKPPVPILRRKIVDDVVLALTSTTNRLIRLHADGGCGKTSLVSGLLAELPPGSELVLYDCYGGGMFLSSDRRRHLPTQAFVQTANELAGRLGSPFVLRSSGLTDLTAGYRRRIEAASKSLHARSQSGLLILVFDAADNARIASEHWQQDCFLDELLGISGLPSNVRVIITYRTARSKTIGSSGLAGAEILLSPFTLEETRSFVHLHQPAWSETTIGELHDLTGGIPRRLAYALDGLSNEETQTAIERLMPRSPGLDPLFEKRVNEAGLRVGDSEAVWRLLCALGNMPRPVPSWALAQITKVLEAEVADLASDLGGIVRHEDGWTFQDEDFEAFARDRTVNLTSDILQQASHLLYAKRDVEKYAARSIAEILMRAGRTADLYGLVLSNELPSVISDPAERRTVIARRLVLALNCARYASNNLDAGSLLLQAAQGLKADKLLNDLLVRHLKLSANFSATELTRLVLTDRRLRSERGRLRLNLALNSALAGDMAASRDHLRWWDAWTRDWASTERNDRAALTSDDIALEFEATYASIGLEAAVDRLLRWRPSTIALSVARILALKAAVAGRLQDILTALNFRTWPSDITLVLVHSALLAGASLNDVVVNFILRATRRVRLPNLGEAGQYGGPSLAVLSEVILVLERAAQLPAHRAAILRNLNRLFPTDFPKTAVKFIPVLEALDLHARVIALKERLTQHVEPAASYLPPAKLVPSENQTDLSVRGMRRQPLSSDEKRARDDAVEWNSHRDTALNVLDSLLKAARQRLEADTEREELTTNIAKLSKDLDDPRHNRAKRACNQATKRFKQTWAIDLALRGTFSIDDLNKLLDSNRPHGALEDIEAISITKGAGPAVCEWLANASVDWEASSGTASDRAATLMRCATVAFKFDPNLAEDLFRRGLGLADKIDVEVIAQLHAASALAEIGFDATREQRVDIAERLADAGGAVAATLGDEGEIHVPWTNILRSCAKLDPATGLASLGRWRDVGIAPFTECVKDLSQANVGFSPIQRLALLSLFGKDTAPFYSAATAEHAARAALVSGRVEQVEEIASQLKSLHPAPVFGLWQDKLVTTATAIELFRSDLKEEEEEAEEESVQSRSGNRSTPITDIASFEQEISAWRSANETAYRRYNFDALADRTSNALIRVPILSALATNFPRDLELVRFFLRVLPEWSKYPPVSKWAAEVLPNYLSHSLRALFEWQYHETELLESALAVTGLPKSRQADIILAGIEVNTDSLSAELLFALVGVLGKLSDSATRIGLLERLLAQITFATDRPPLVSIVGAKAPENAIEAITRFLFALMGDVDKRIRWRAAHAVRLMAAQENADFMKSFVHLLSSESESVFAAPNVPFYLMAARQQLIVTLHRIALERPSTLRVHASALAQAAIGGPPHIVIRQFAKAAALAIEASYPGSLNADTIDSVARVNVSQFTKVKEKRQNFRNLDYHKILSDLRYRFDNTDTIPYWYQPAASVFGVFVPEFARHAERWICDAWSLQPDSWKWLNEPRTQRFGENSYDLTSHRHGSEPTIERLSRYAEWHAMQCAMGEFLITHPIVEGFYGDEFEEWLLRHGLTESDTWLSDLRSPPPLEAQFWGFYNPSEIAEDNWLAPIKQEVFDKALSQTDSNKSITVRAQTSVTIGRLTEHVSISSAFVTSKTAIALGRALQTVRDPMDYCIPPAADSREIKETGFTLRGWLTDSERSPRIDATDTERGMISGIPFRPAREVLRKMGLTFDLKCHGWKRSHSIEPELTFAWWDRDGDDEEENNGWRGIADRHFLMDLLKSFRMSLILDVEISHRIKSEYRSRGEDERRRGRRLYIFRADGSLHPIDPVLGGPACYWVRKLGLEPGVDTLGRWIVHRAEELDRARLSARGAKANRFEAQLRQTLQKLIEHHTAGRR